MYGGAAVGSAAREAAKSYIKTAVQRRVLSGTPVTTQHDVQRRYRRKPMPRRRRRAWKKFTRKVKHVMLQMNSLTTYSQDTLLRTQWNSNKQATFGVILGGTQVSNNDDLFQIFRMAYNAAVNTTTVDALKLFVKSMCLDVQITNTGSNGAILDVYEVACRKSYASNVSLGQAYTDLYNQLDSPQTNSPDPTSPASTPFQNGQFCSYWKILSKKEILLGAGQVTTMQMRIPYDRVLPGTVIRNNLQAIPGISRAYLFQVRGSPRWTGTVSELGAGEVTMGYQIGIVYGIPPGSQTSTAGDI